MRLRFLLVACAFVLPLMGALLIRTRHPAPNLPFPPTVPVATAAVDAVSVPAAPLIAADAAAFGERVLDVLRSRAPGPALAALAHPEEGIRFTPYTDVEEENVRMQASELAATPHDRRKLHWGTYEESDVEIVLPFAEYLEKFANDRDFRGAAPPPMGFDEMTVDNSQTFYGPDAIVLAYYLAGREGSPQTWRILRLVLRRKDGRLFVVGIIHSEWTP